MQGSIINNGIVITAEDRASAIFGVIGQSFQKMRQEFAVGAKEIPKKTEEAFRPFQNLENVLRTNIKDGFQSATEQLNEDFRAFNRDVRHHINNFNSIIMGGVAVAMSGLGIQRAGQAITGMISGWVGEAEEFERVMRQVKFLGQVTDEEYKKLTKRIMDLGIALPSSNLEVAQGVLDTLRLGFDAMEAEYMARPVTLLSFFSEGAIDTAESAQLLNQIMKMLNMTVDDTDSILDKLLATMRYTAFDIGELVQAWHSAADMPGYLEGNLEDFLALLSITRTGMIPRRAAQTARSFLQSIYTAMASEGKRGDIWDALGIDLDSETDPLVVLEKISQRSIELWGDTADRTSKLLSAFNQRGMATIVMYEKYMESADKSIHEVRDLIKESDGFAESYLEEIMGTLWGIREVYRGTLESLKQVLGELFAPVIIPLLKAVQQLFAYGVEFVRAYPGFARVLGVLLGISGVLMTVVGTLMLFGGQLLSIYGSLMNVTLQMAVLGVQSAETFSKMSAQSLTVGQLLRQQIMAPLAAIRKVMFGLTGLSVLFYLTWRYDFLRIRSIVTEFFGNIRKSSKDVNERLTTMTGDAVYEMTKLDLQSSNFWKRLTGYLTVSTILWRGFTEAIRNFREEGIFGLSNDLMSLLTGLSPDQLASMDEIDPNKFPLLRTLTSVLELIQAIKSAWDGFVEGMKEGYGVIENFILKPLEAIFGDILGESNLLDWDETAERYRPNIEAWEKMGKMVGNILSYTIAIKLALFAWKNTIGSIIKMGGKVKGAIFGGGDKKGLLSYLTGKGSFGRAVRKGTLRQARDIWPKGQYPEGIKPTNWIRTGKDLPFFSKIFGNRLYSYKTGQYLGREPVKGMPKFLSKGTKDYPVLGRLGNIRGLNLLMKTPVLGGISMLLGALGEEKGQRVKGAASAGVQFAGSMVGAKAGAAIGTAIMPGIGTIAGTIIGGITGAIVSSPFAEIIGNWIQDAYSWLVENVLNAEAITRIFEAVKKFFLETLPYNLGEWIGTLAAEGYLFITRVCTEDIPKWYEDTKQTLIDWFNNIGPSLREWWEKTGWEGVWSFIQRFLDAINPKNWIDRGWANLVEMGKNLANGIKSGFNTAIANSKTSNGVTKTMPKYSYSHGGFITKPHVGLVGEDGPEAIIPLSSKYRSNALRLWGEVGKRIAEPGFSGAQRTTAHGGGSGVAVVSPTGSGGGSINKTEIIFGENSIVLKFDSLSNTSDAKKAARELFSEFKKLMEEDNIRNYGVARQRA